MYLGLRWTLLWTVLASCSVPRSGADASRMAPDSPTEDGGGEAEPGDASLECGDVADWPCVCLGGSGSEDWWRAAADACPGVPVLGDGCTELVRGASWCDFVPSRRSPVQVENFLEVSDAQLPEFVLSSDVGFSGRMDCALREGCPGLLRTVHIPAPTRPVTVGPGAVATTYGRIAVAFRWYQCPGLMGCEQDESLAVPWYDTISVVTSDGALAWRLAGIGALRGFTPIPGTDDLLVWFLQDDGVDSVPWGPCSTTYLARLDSSGSWVWARPVMADVAVSRVVGADVAVGGLLAGERGVSLVELSSGNSRACAEAEGAGLRNSVVNHQGYVAGFATGRLLVWDVRTGAVRYYDTGSHVDNVARFVSGWDPEHIFADTPNGAILVDVNDGSVQSANFSELLGSRDGAYAPDEAGAVVDFDGNILRSLTPGRLHRIVSPFSVEARVEDVGHKMTRMILLNDGVLIGATGPDGFEARDTRAIESPPLWRVSTRHPASLVVTAADEFALVESDGTISWWSHVHGDLASTASSHQLPYALEARVGAPGTEVSERRWSR